MAYIKSIRFDHVGKNEGCCCDKCGQYIRNIWTVEYQDGVVMSFGIDCFSKLNKGKLNAYGMKLMNKALKSIEYYQQMFEAEKVLTEETDLRYQHTQEHVDWKDDDVWYGQPWEEYHKWMLEVWYPAMFENAQKEINRFKKVNFDR